MSIDAMTRGIPTVEVLKALADPIRWEIITQAAAVDELACSILENTLPVSKPTISYHAKILISAGLITVRKEGKNLYYTFQPDAIGSVFVQLEALAPTVVSIERGNPQLSSIEPAGGANGDTASNNEDTASKKDDPTVLTW